MTSDWPLKLTAVVLALVTVSAIVGVGYIITHPEKFPGDTVTVTVPSCQ